LAILRYSSSRTDTVGAEGENRGMNEYAVKIKERAKAYTKEPKKTYS
jgi:hypothetical protein